MAPDNFQIRQEQFGVNNFNIPHRIQSRGDMRDILGLEAAHHVDQQIHVPDMGQKLVAQPLALAGALDEPGDVHEFHGGGGELGGLEQLSQGFQTGSQAPGRCRRWG